MIRSILLPIADEPASALDFALWLAREGNRRISGLALIDIKAFEIPVLGTPDGFLPSIVTPPMRENQSLIEELTALAKARIEGAAAACAARNLIFTGDVRTGIPGEIVTRTAAAHDIVVMSRTGYSRITGTEEKPDPLVAQVVHRSIRPVLVAGAKFPAAQGIRHILVAYDGSTHAGRALTVAAELGARPGVKCTLMTVASTEESGEEILAAAELFLLNHDVKPQKLILLGTKPSEMICQSVTNAGIDILIMGAFGRSPVREMFFGSTTRQVLSHCATTVILQY
jgi:nucleotide-binding universal stress UspA family protein